MKSFQKALIGWKKAGPPKSHVCFNHVNTHKQAKYSNILSTVNGNLSFNLKAITIKFLPLSWAHCQRNYVFSV